MFDLLLAGAVGLLVGWFFLPKPQWADDLMAKIKGMFGA